MILAILQVRMNSPRLPGKALAPLHQASLVWRQVERLRLARCVSRIIVATSDSPEDAPLAGHLLERGQAVFRGSATNLAERFRRCVDAAGPVRHLVRVKGDSAFLDPGLVDETVRLAINSGADYTSNRVRRSFPRGLEVEVVTPQALLSQPASDAAESSSPFAQIRSQPERYPQAHCLARRDVSSLDWRVKTAADLAFANGVYGALHPVDAGFGYEEVLSLTQNRQDLRRWAA